MVVAAPAPPVRPPPPFEVPPPADKVVAIGRGDRHACVVRASGAVDCWGEPRRCTGEYCQTQRAADPSVRRIAGVDDAVAISRDARCVVRRTGEVACLADDVVEFRPVAGLAHVTAIDPHSSCFIVAPGTVSCRDDTGALWTARGIRDAVALTSSRYNICAVRRSGAVACGSAWDRGAWKTVRGLDHVTDFALSPSYDSGTCCAVTGGRVRCFALDDVYDAPKVNDTETRLADEAAFAGATELSFTSEGYGDQVLEARVGGSIVRATLSGRAETVPLITDAVTHVGGCAVRAQGSVACWGPNSGGALAQPTTIDRVDAPPAPVAGLADVTDLALGLTVSYALTRDGRLFQWGKDRATHAVPRPLGLGPHDLVQITADGGDRPCMRSADGEVWCEVGGYRLDRRIEQLDTEDAETIIAGSESVTVLRRERGEAHALAGYQAALSVTAFDRRGIVDIGGVSEPGCDLHRDGTVTSGKAIAGITAATAVACGWRFGCAIQRAEVWCWNYHLDTYKADAAMRVADLDGATDLAASPDQVCAVHAGGRVSCWSFADDGAIGAIREVVPGGAVDVELGHASADQLDTSRRVLDGPDPAGAYGCAIMTDRTVTCWGANLFGELGDDSFVESATPIGVRL